MDAKPIYVLVRDLFFATKIIKTAQALNLEARAFDSSDRIVQAAGEKEPALVILDCEGLEKEAFLLLGKLRPAGTLSAVPVVGYLSHGAQDLKREMRNAGCNQVYTKSEFSKGLENLLMRHTHGFSSRI